MDEKRGILRDAWKGYAGHAGPTAILILVPLLFRLGSVQLVQQLARTPFAYTFGFSLLLAFAWLCGMFLWSWCLASLVDMVGQDSSLVQASRNGLCHTIVFAWLGLLVSTLFSTGCILLIVPGIIFAAWMAPAFFIVTRENETGFKALFLAKQQVTAMRRHLISRKGGAKECLLYALIAFVGTLLFSLNHITHFYSYIPNSGPILTVTGIVLSLLSLVGVPFFLEAAHQAYRSSKALPADLGKRSVVLSLAVVPGLLLLGLRFLLLILTIFWGRDCPPPDDADLALAGLPADPEQNAYMDFKQALGRLYLNQKLKQRLDYSPKFENWNQRAVLELITKNREALRLFEAGLKKKYFQENLSDIAAGNEKQSVKNAFSNEFNMFRMNDLLRVIGWKSRLHRRQARYLAAWKEARNILRAASMLENAPRLNVIQLLVGIGARRLAWSQIKPLLSTGKADKSLLGVIQSDIDKLAFRPKSIANALKYDYASFKHSISLINRGLQKGRAADTARAGLVPGSQNDLPLVNFYFKPNLSKKKAAGFYRRLMRWASDSSIQSEQDVSKFKSPDTVWGMLLYANAVGDILASIVQVNIERTIEMIVKSRAKFRLLTTLVAVRRYQLDNDCLPDRLSRLVPGYLDRLPRDVFTGHTVRYSLTKKIIYSVGPDLTDDGGQKEKDIVEPLGF